MGKVQKKVSKGNKGIIKVISVAAMLGSFGSLVSGHLIALNRNTVAALAGGLIMAVVVTIADKKNLKWLKEWGLAIALFLAVIFNIVPPASAILTGFITMASAVGVVWFVEPISYFPIIGVAATWPLAGIR